MSNVVFEAAPQTQKEQTRKVIFDRISPESFQKTVKNKVDQYFTSNSIAKTANTEMIAKSVFIIAGWMITYFLIISNLVAPWIMLILAMAHGIFTALIGLNIAHDAIHGSFFKSAKWNKRLGYLFNVVGANDYVWTISHNIVHHTYTNIPHHDEDLHQLPIMRMEPTQALWKMHKYQYIYAFFLYPLASLSWVFIKDYVKFFQHQLGAHYRETFPRREIFRLFAYKAVYYTLFLVIPLVVINLPWYWIVFGFVMSHFVEGYLLAIVFMLGHIIEGTEYPEPDSKGGIAMTWADLQLHTSADFATKNRLANFLFGGLNFQIEHHLFPQVCHTHYPKIAPIVKQTAVEFGLPYLEHKTFWGAIKSHQRVLKKFGRE